MRAPTYTMGTQSGNPPATDFETATLKMCYSPPEPRLGSSVEPVWGATDKNGHPFYIHFAWRVVGSDGAVVASGTTCDEALAVALIDEVCRLRGGAT